MTYNTRLHSKQKRSITAPAPSTTKRISKQARLNVTKSVLVYSFLIMYGHNVSHLIFSSCYVRVSLISRFFLCREIREINVSRKFHVIR